MLGCTAKTHSRPGRLSGSGHGRKPLSNRGASTSVTSVATSSKKHRDDRVSPGESLNKNTTVIKTAKTTNPGKKRECDFQSCHIMLFRMPNFQQQKQQKTIRNANKQGRIVHIHTLTKISVETVPEEAEVLDLLDKIFKSTLLNMLKEPKETMSKAVTEEMPEVLAARWWTRRAQAPDPTETPIS